MTPWAYPEIFSMKIFTRGKKKQKKRTFFTDNFFKKNCRGVISEYLPWLLIAIAVLTILMITIFLLRGSGISLIDKIKNLFGGR